jgi:hypothetical protein
MIRNKEFDNNILDKIRGWCSWKKLIRRRKEQIQIKL